MTSTPRRINVREVPRADILTQRQDFDLLLYLVENAERAVGYDELLVRVWGCDYTEGSRGAVQSCVKRVCRKIESDPSRPHHLLTVRGVGYRWAVPPAPVPPQPPTG